MRTLEIVDLCLLVDWVPLLESTRAEIADGEGLIHLVG